VLQSRRKIKAAQRIFQSVLRDATPNWVFDEGQMSITGKGRWLKEFTSNNKALAKAVLEMDFPEVHGSIELDHYTSMPALKNIAAKEQLYLHTVTKRLKEGEIFTYAKDHGLEGFLAKKGQGSKLIKEIADDLFYISLTGTENPAKAKLWKVFANGEQGVCLRLRVTPEPRADMRHIRYQNGKPTTLNRINNQLFIAEGLTYMPWMTSRICAFHLPAHFGDECEVRLMVKRYLDPCFNDLAMKAGGYEVWPIALVAPGTKSSDIYCKVELIKVIYGRDCKSENVHAALAGTIFSDVPIIIWRPLLDTVLRWCTSARKFLKLV
jgi:hypothetical protein